MGSRKISLEPAASCFGFRGLLTMKVSLCGPHSFETSTFAGVEPLVAAARNESGPSWARIWNLSHQVGSWLSLAASAGRAVASAAIRVRTCMSASGSWLIHLSCSGCCSRHHRLLKGRRLVWGSDGAAESDGKWVHDSRAFV